MTNSNLDPMYNRYAQSKIKEQTKVREILQQVALLGLERQGFFEKAAFYGGTALRLLYGLDRFSEDLDFTLLKSDPEFDFSPYLEGMRQELASLGYQMEITKKSKGVDNPIQSAFMKGNTEALYLKLNSALKTSNPNEKIQIKLEIDTDPPHSFKVENRLILDPTPFYVLTLELPDLFAGKMAAILFRAWGGRVKGRDWYDLIWYVQNKTPLNLNCLESFMRQNNSLSPDEKLELKILLDKLQEKIEKLDWDAAKADMRAFIPDPERLDIWSPDFFKQLIQRIVVTK